MAVLLNQWICPNVEGMMNDLISRKALCDYALNQKDKSVTPNDIMRFPSAQPERWIPCSERLPKVRQWVLCQCRAGIIDVLRLTDDGCWYRKSNEIYMSGFVLAWMPLPEPYKTESEDKE